jgi:copper chaperone CopZ
MKTIMSIFLASLLMAQPVFAGPMTTTLIKVNGLVCDFCARSIEKVMGEKPGITGVKVNLDDGLIALTGDGSATYSDAELTKLVNDAGYSVTSITHQESK